MPDIQLRLNVDTLVIEGAMGTMLQRMGIASGSCPEFLNVTDPETVEQVHLLYKVAGADCCVTNSFGGTRAKLSEYGLEDQLEELNRAAVRIARKSGAPHILGDVGPCGLVMEPLGTATFDQVYQQYYEQVTALAKENPDAILIETMVDIADARCALLAAKDACDLPVFVTCTFNQDGYMDLSGTTPEAAALILDSCGADAVGMNCGLGPDALYPLLVRMAKVTELPLIIQPNAGLPTLMPNGQTVYPGTADEMAQWAVRFREAGASLIGSCCGSTPSFTGAIYGAVGATDAPRHTKAPEFKGTVLASARTTLPVGGANPCRILGERINPTGKPRLSDELREGKLSEVRSLALEQQEAGADLLDVNVGAVGVDAAAVLPRAMVALQAATPLPLVIDTTDFEAMEAALKAYPGRALLNSTNGEAASFMKVLPLAKRYGAAVVVLALDETGIPKTVQGRLDIIQKVRTFAHSYGLSDKDLVIDTLVMTAAAAPTAAEVTLGALSAVKEWGLSTMLGVSNISHGLPLRPELNSAFVEAAVLAGLDLAIVNPNNRVVAESVLTASKSRGTRTVAEAMEGWDAMFAHAQEIAKSGAEKLAAPEGLESKQERDPKKALAAAIYKGDSDAAPDLVDSVVQDGMEPGDVIGEILTPAIQRMGDAFGRGEAFLPQMMVAADAMKAAVAQVKTYLPETSQEHVTGRVVFCTVKGDVHSIGKDICVSLLESQGFLVRDLGVDVAPDEVLAAARELGAEVVCLSALMTTTLPSMTETAALVKEELPGVAVLVGGAVVTEAYAQSVECGYAPDAPTCVDLARQAVEKRRALIG